MHFVLCSGDFDASPSQLRGLRAVQTYRRTDGQHSAAIADAFNRQRCTLMITGILKAILEITQPARRFDPLNPILGWVRVWHHAEHETKPRCDKPFCIADSTTVQ